MATRSCGRGRNIRPSPMPFAYKLPSWHLVVMTTAHSSQNSFGSETQKEGSQRGVIDKNSFSFVMKTLLTLCFHVNPIIVQYLQEMRKKKSHILYEIIIMNVGQIEWNVTWVCICWMFTVIKNIFQTLGIFLSRRDDLHSFSFLDKLILQIPPWPLEDTFQSASVFSLAHLIFCKPLYNSSQTSHVPNPQSLRGKVNSADNTVSSAGSMQQEVYTAACPAKRIIFSSRATEPMLFHSHPGSAYWPVKLPCCGLRCAFCEPGVSIYPSHPHKTLV